MKSGKLVIDLSRKLEKELKTFSKKIAVAGSIRRGERYPKDIDLVLIPKERVKLEDFMKKIGKFVEGGEHESTWKIEGVKVELYYTNKEEWGAELLAYSGKKGSNIGLRSVAKRKGMKLNQYGLFKDGRRLAGKTEKEIYEKLGRKYKKPEDR
ncbi:MAG: hypothetical protein KKB62_00255 [Nanoarchaeota archaeon]|nr:hypothetical protein [Nanoarchaeota archaeon]